MNNITTSFPIYNKYEYQSRFRTRCEDICDFDLICDGFNLLPFQFRRTPSVFPIDRIVLRRSCDTYLQPLLTYNESQFITNGGWMRNDWSLRSGQVVADVQLPGTVAYNNLFTIGKKYQLMVTGVIRSTTNGLTGLSYNIGGYIGTQTTNGHITISTTFTATSTNVLFTAITPNVDDFVAINEFYVSEVFDTMPNDIELPTTMIEGFNKQIDGVDYDYFVYCGQGFDMMLPCGKYYLIIDTIEAQYFSEVFTIKDFNQIHSPYLKLEWSNSCDLGDVISNTNCGLFTNTLWINATLQEPTYDYTEEGSENQLGEFNATRQVWSKVRKLILGALPEYVVDALTQIKMFDNVRLTLPYNASDNLTAQEVLVCKNVDFKVNNVLSNCYANVELNFTTDNRIYNSTCCTNYGDVCLSSISVSYTDVIELPLDSFVIGIVLAQSGIYQFEFSNDNGTTWTPYLMNVYGTGTYTVTLPSGFAPCCGDVLIRLSYVKVGCTKIDSTSIVLKNYSTCC